MNTLKCASEPQVAFNYQGFRNSWYSFYQPQKGKIWGSLLGQIWEGLLCLLLNQLLWNIHTPTYMTFQLFSFQLFSNLQIFYVLLPDNSSQGIRILPTNYTLLASLTVVGCCLDSPKPKISFYGTGGYLYHLFPLEKCHLSALEIWCWFGHSPKVLDQKQLDVWNLCENSKRIKSHQIFAMSLSSEDKLDLNIEKISRKASFLKGCMIMRYDHDP